jgi:hypothetical protein
MLLRDQNGPSNRSWYEVNYMQVVRVKHRQLARRFFRFFFPAAFASAIWPAVGF